MKSDPVLAEKDEEAREKKETNGGVYRVKDNAHVETVASFAEETLPSEGPSTPSMRVPESRDIYVILKRA